MKLEKGKTYKTRGGWEALIIWESSAIFRSKIYHAIHKPNTEHESCPINHFADGRAASAFAIGDPPSFGLHPSDLVEEIITEDKQND